jgi:hypothetical protein
MPQTRRTIYIMIGCALCLGGVLVFYAAAHQWFPLVMNPSDALSQRPNLALIGLLGVVALVGGVSFLAKAFLPETANQRAVDIALGVTLCVTAVLGLVYTVQGGIGAIGRKDGDLYLLAWGVLGVVSVVVLFTGARAIYEARWGTRIPSRTGARHTPQSIF